MSNINNDDIVLAEVVHRGGLNRKYFRPQDLRRLSHATFSSRRAIEGLYSGKHKTVQRGQSVEFRDYREYIPGDEINHLDWKVFGRTDKLFIKLFEHQTDLTVHLLVDCSRSMAFCGYSPRGDNKYDSCCRLAAAIGFLISKQHDRFSFATAKRGLKDFLQARGSIKHLIDVLDHMEQVRLEEVSGLSRAVEQLIQVSKKRDLLCVFSDLLDESFDEQNEGLLKQLKIWMERGGEVIVFHVLHDDELTLPAGVGAGTFVDSESRKKLKVDLDSIRRDYQANIKCFLQTWSSHTAKIGVDYNLVRVSDPYSKVLEKYFARRGDRLTSRSRNFSHGVTRAGNAGPNEAGQALSGAKTPEIIFIAD